MNKYFTQQNLIIASFVLMIVLTIVLNVFLLSNIARLEARLGGSVRNLEEQVGQLKEDLYQEAFEEGVKQTKTAIVLEYLRNQQLLMDIPVKDSTSTRRVILRAINQ